MWQLSITEDGLGSIQIDDFKESFQADLSFWSKSDYEHHWDRATQALNKGSPVVFITSITDPMTSNFIRSWACYPTSGDLIFQEQILFLDDLEKPFNLEKPHSNCLPYESVTEDGEGISEWRISREI